MRKLGKKMLSLVLALALCLSLVPGHFITTAHAGGRGRVLVDEDGTIHEPGFGNHRITDPSGKTTDIKYDYTETIYGDGWSYSPGEILTLNGYHGRYICGNIRELVLADGSENYLSAMCLSGFALDSIRISGSGTLTLEYNEEVLNPSDGSFFAENHSWRHCLLVEDGTFPQFASRCFVLDCYHMNSQYEYDYPECKLEFADGLTILGGVKNGDAQTIQMNEHTEPRGTSKFYADTRSKLQMSETADGKPASYVRIAPQSSMSQQPTTPAQPAQNTAYASTQNVLVDGKAVEFQAYALKDEKGNDINYVKLRDVAYALNGTAAQFSVGWDQAAKSISVTSGEAYEANGSEMKTPYSGNRAYTVSSSPLYVNGKEVDLGAILLTDDAGSGYTYFKLRDLGEALGFAVDWSADKGIYIETK